MTAPAMVHLIAGGDYKIVDHTHPLRLLGIVALKPPSLFPTYFRRKDLAQC